MHNSLLQTLGEASKHLHEVEQQRQNLSVAFDERFRLCEVQSDLIKKLHGHNEEKELHLNSVLEELEATKDAGLRNLALKEEKLQQLQTEVHLALQVKAQEIQQLEAVIATLRQTESAQKKKIEELDAEIKHAFNDLQRNDEMCKEMSSRAKLLGTELQDTRKDLELAAEEIEKKSRESQAAMSAHQQQLADVESQMKDKELQIQSLTQEMEQLKATKAAEKESLVAELADAVTAVQVMSEQQRAAGQAAEEDLQDELAKREAVVIQIQEELRQKDMLLQQISMAAAPDAPVIPSPAKRNVATPMRSSRVPRPTPPRFADGPPKGRSPVADLSDQESSQDNDADDEGLRRRTRRQLHDGLHPSVIPKLSPAKNSQKRPSPNGPQSVQTRNVLEDGRPSRKRTRGRAPLPPTEYELDFLNGDDLSEPEAITSDAGDDEEYLQRGHSYQTRGRQQKRVAPLSKKRVQQNKAQARAALAASVGKKGRFSTMSAHSLGSDDERGTASYEASTLGKRGYYNSAALDIFGNAALDPYSFHA
ncbi:hypothetical protein WJX75_008680 [Coccomyxa subellipsoidea]|uniref:Uncharacterized protein n=1 Tax=Coccomyxa subellipsoidea TaxID=248742 RepID=A0ABR2YPH3_9CHLO